VLAIGRRSLLGREYRVVIVSRQRELGRGERVLPGLWRLRLALPWPGVPHCNAWAIAAGDGIVLVDTGMHEPDSMAQLERAMDQVGLRLEQVRLLVCTHAHSDHWGQAAPIRDRTLCDFWMHRRPEPPRDENGGERSSALARRIEVARQSGVPEAAIKAFVERVKDMPSGVAREIEPDRELVPGVEVETDLGTWTVYETPGHTPSHICPFQAERRLLISGDHVLGRISLFFDYGWTPDPIGEFLHSLDETDELGARLALSGHGKPFIDVPGHIEGNRRLVHERLDAALAAVRDEPKAAVEIAPSIFGEPLTEANAGWRLQETLSYLRHLELAGRISRGSDGDLARWEFRAI
jgi:glyoxylase-like metal-dependent hydrolase (beta-lactamase superfamily II)